jgi:putative OPT family oligopeptide transporter
LFVTASSRRRHHIQQQPAGSKTGSRSTPLPGQQVALVSAWCSARWSFRRSSTCSTRLTFEGAPGAKATALAAPQAAIISTIAQGVLGGSLDWGLIRQGAIIGAVAVVVDEGLKRTSGKRLHLPPLAIGMGIYLPLEADLLIPFGAVLGWFYNRGQ